MLGFFFPGVMYELLSSKMSEFWGTHKHWYTYIHDPFIHSDTWCMCTHARHTHWCYALKYSVCSFIMVGVYVDDLSVPDRKCNITWCPSVVVPYITVSHLSSLAMYIVLYTGVSYIGML